VQQVARPGAKDYEAWGAAISEIVMGGSELPFHNHWGSGLHPYTLTRASHATLERGYVMVNEIEAAYGGWGDTVVLSVDGPRRLGSRPPGLVFTGE